VKDLGYWTHLCLELFCAINWDYNSKKDKYNYQMIDKNGSFLTKNGKFRTKKVPNEKYEEGIEKPTPPDYCKKKLCYGCLANDCPHLAYTEAERWKKGKRKGEYRL
jgi:hypothetical protein